MILSGATVNGSLPKSITSLDAGGKEGIEEEGLTSQAIEAAGAVEEAAGFGAAIGVASKLTGTKTGTQVLAGAVNKAESAGQKGEEKAASALTGWVGELTGWLGENAIKVLLDVALVLIGGVLLIAGIVIALKPRGPLV